MDKSGIIREHSKIKLELYRLYLERYLSVLLVANFFNRIDIIDIFAGCGVSDNDEKGSSLIAAETIETVNKTKNPRNKEIFLKLNEANQKNCAALQQHVKPYSFADVNCGDANTFVQRWQPVRGGHNLFFIDPHGYTQIETANLKRLFRTSNCDLLIFIPIYHIYRFLKPIDKNNENSKNKEDLLIEFPEETKKRKRSDPDSYYAPISKFLEGLGIDQDAAKKADSAEEFAEMILLALKQFSGAKYVYKNMFDNAGKNSKYCLFFVTHHILGGDKFLEAQSQLNSSKTEILKQKMLDLSSPSDYISVLDFIEYNHSYDNVSLYQLGIESGLAVAQLRNQLQAIEKNSSNVIEINEIQGKKRNKSGLYIDYKNYKIGNRVITITFRR